MDNALGMDNDVYLVGIQIKEPLVFDELQPNDHQGVTINYDIRHKIQNHLIKIINK
jgi:hypothetical protein